MVDNTENQTVGEVRKREADVLYALVLMFTYGQMALIVWDMLSLVPGFGQIVGLTGANKVHSYGELTSMYLGLLGIYIGRNAWLKYNNKEDTDTVPTYVFLRIQRGYFYMGLWGTLCFVAYMLKAVTLISRMPFELVITTFGVIAALFGDKAIKGFLDKRTVGQLQNEASAVDHSSAIMNFVETNNRITNAECRKVTGLGEAQATRVLEELEKQGILEQKGSGRGTFYQKK